MGRRKAEMKLIAHGSTRLATFKKRRASVIKKAKELSTLCGIDVCVVVSEGPDDPAPVMWPPAEEATRIINRFQSRSEEVRTKDLSRQVAKLQVELQQTEHANEKILKDMFPGTSSSGDSVAILSAMAERRLKEVEERINFLKSAHMQHHPASLDVGCATAGSREAMLPAHVIWLSTEYGMERGSTSGPIGAAAGSFPTGSMDVAANLSDAFTSEEDLPGLADAFDTNDWISSAAPNFPEWENLLADWTSVFGPVDDVASQPDLCDFDFDLEIDVDDETIKSVMSSID